MIQNIKDDVYKIRNLLHKKNQVLKMFKNKTFLSTFVTNSNFVTPKSLQPDGVNGSYFKLRLDR